MFEPLLYTYGERETVRSCRDPSFPESLLLARVDADRSRHLGLESVNRLDRQEGLSPDDDGWDEDNERDEDGCRRCDRVGQLAKKEEQERLRRRKDLVTHRR